MRSLKNGSITSVSLIGQGKRIRLKIAKSPARPVAAILIISSFVFVLKNTATKAALRVIKEGTSIIKNY